MKLTKEQTEELIDHLLYGYANWNGSIVVDDILELLLPEDYSNMPIEEVQKVVNAKLEKIEDII